MDAAYFDNGKADDVASFEMFIRSLPEDWGYFIAVGIDEAIDYACGVRFTDEDVSYLQGLNTFKDDYLDYLHHFRFRGDIVAIREGTPFTANSPVLRITARRMEAQLLETAILNIVNFQTLIASKASRVVNAAGKAKVVDFGLRRAQGFDAGIKGARAAYIAGAVATSNVEAAKLYRINPSGTMAHSFVMGFDDEVDAFRAYSKSFPNSSTFLIDTYDTIEGVSKAATVAREMERDGHRLAGVRLDSGNLKGLAKQIRRILDEQNLNYVKIVLSSDLNEYKIDEYNREGAPVDYYGVGTEMITGKPVSALSGVYKLVEDNLGPRIKLSEDKRTYPGRKQVHRVVGTDGKFVHDVLETEGEPLEGIHLLETAVKRGRRVRKIEPLDKIRDYSLEAVSKLPDDSKRIRNCKPYEMIIGSKLRELTEHLVARYGRA